MSVMVKKRDGSLESLDIEKIHKVITWAAQGLEVSVSQVELKSQIQLFDGITTEQIHEIMIKSAADLISEQDPDYQFLAARLSVYHIKKKVFKDYNPQAFDDYVKSMVLRGLYDLSLTMQYNHEELKELANYIKLERDDLFSYAAIKQWEGKYLLQNRVSGEIYEIPQYAYMAIAMSFFVNYPKEVRLDYVKGLYDATSTFALSLPTPIMSGLRTPTRQFSSCVLIEADDSLDSINATASAVVKYISQRAGIGVNAGKIRGLGSVIRGGEAFHTGVIPFLKYFQSAVKSCSQGGVRGGAATVFFPLWHWEIENILVLKNNRGVEENRVRHMDYGIQINKFLYQRLLTGGDITLFSFDQVADLYDAFFADQDEFERLYVAYEQNPTVRKKTVKAIELFTSLMQERAQTGRIYIHHVDHTNTHGAFNPKVAPVKQSNLCVAPDTPILTDRGYQAIGQLENEWVNVWNGHEFSQVQVLKTGENSPMLTLEMSTGQIIETTDYHKFYIKDDLGVKEVRAYQLHEGDELIGFDLPIVIHGSQQLEAAYQKGLSNINPLSEELDWVGIVPTANFAVTDRIDWLSGLLSQAKRIEGDKGVSLQMSHINRLFLMQTQLMLQELGIHAYLRPGAISGEKKKGYEVTLIIPARGVVTLTLLGLSMSNYQQSDFEGLLSYEMPTKVSRIVDHGVVSDTYCFNEPKEHKGMFAGLLTGQCMEITLPTKPMNHIHDEDGEIALCTLAAINLDRIENDHDMKVVTDLAVRALDELLDYQDYPVKAAEKAKGRRSLGIGITNYAHWLAKQNMIYSDGSANDKTHEMMESFQYHLLLSSAQLAKEKGACSLFHETSYAQGLLPIDTYKKEIDSVHGASLKQDWSTLRELIAQYGLRNSTLSALMPCETSSQITNSTNGIEPVRGLISVKASKDGVLKQVVPGIGRYYYETLWSMPSNKGYLDLVGIMTKFIDQSVSANTNYDPSKFEGEKVPLKLLMSDLTYAYKVGIKTLYYHNTRDGAGVNEDDGCAGGACKV